MKEELKMKMIDLRKEQKSYREIAQLLGISKSVVSYWLRDMDWSRDIQEQLTERVRISSQKRLIHLNELKRTKWQKVYQQAELEATREFEQLKENRIFITGLSLYWGEGDKNFKNGKVRVSNVDAKLLAAFRVFLEEVCRVPEEKMKAYIVLYPDLDEEACLKFWSENIGLKKESFFKSSTITGRHKKNRLQYGVCSIQVGDKYLKRKVLTWIDLFARMF